MRRWTSKKLQLGERGRRKNDIGRQTGRTFIVTYFVLITIVCAYAFIRLSGPTSHQWQGPDSTLGTFFPFPVLCGLHNLLCVRQQQLFPVVKSNSCHLSNDSRLQKNNLSIAVYRRELLPGLAETKMSGSEAFCGLNLTHGAPAGPH